MRRLFLCFTVLALLVSVVPSASVVAQETTSPVSESERHPEEDAAPGLEFGSGVTSLVSTALEVEPRPSGRVKSSDAELASHVDDLPEPAGPPEAGSREESVSGRGEVSFDDVGVRLKGVPEAVDQVRLVVPEPGFSARVSSVGLVFGLDLGGADVDLGATSLVVDYSGAVEGRPGLAPRLGLAWFEGCSIVVVDVGDEAEPDLVDRLVCDRVEKLSAVNDLGAKTLEVGLTSDKVRSADAFAEVAGASALEADGGVSGQSAVSHSSPLGGGFFAMSSSSGGPEGDFGATPLSTVADHQVSLFTGSLDLSIPFATPPASAGRTPEAGLVYSSGSVDGMNTATNNQASTVGLGWSMVGGGSITRHSKDCTTGDLCPTGHDYTLTLNGVTSRLVQVGSTSEFRLKSDPNWRVELKSGASNDDAHGDYWVVTTTDGTQYRFGYETQAADYVPFYTYQVSESPFDCEGYEFHSEASHLCYKVWKWNLDRVMDTSGNKISYSYIQELNYYAIRQYDPQVQHLADYVRSSHLREVLYTDNGSLDPSARVIYLTELRCTNPENASSCDSDNDFRDTPMDLVCRKDDSCIDDYAPTFFSERRIGDVMIQVVDGGSWRTVSWWDLVHLFPDPTESGDPESSERKLWLDELKQRPGGSYAWSAYSHLEAEDADSQSGTDTGEAADYGQGTHVKSLHDGDYLLFENVDFEDGAEEILVRVASNNTTGDIEFYEGSISGSPFATIEVSDTGGLNEWETLTLTLSGGPTGVEDLYVVFDDVSSGSLGRINWIRFDAATNLPNLPSTQFESVNLANRIYVSEHPMRMPRIDQMTNTLGGVLDVTFGQEYPWETEEEGPAACRDDWNQGNVRRPCDFFIAYDSYEGEWWWFNKWKVMETTQSDPNSESQDMTLTYEYGIPAWHYSDTPGYNSHTGSPSGGLTCSELPCNHWNDFRGHDIVEVTDVGDTTTEFTFYQGMNKDWMGDNGWDFSASIELSDSSTRTDHEWLAGQIAEQRVLDASTDERTRTETKYHWSLNAGSSPRGAYFTGPDDIETWIDETEIETRQKLTYDTYGNVTGIEQRGRINGIGASVDDSYTETAYVVNTTDWIVSTPRYEKVWPGLSTGTSGNELSYVEFFYDGAGSSSTAPTDGLLTRRRTFFETAPGTESADTDFTYDARGRLNITTTEEGRITNNDYHSTYGYLSQVKLENGDDDLITGYDVDPGTGLPLEVTDANGNETTYQYDDYNRLVEATQPTEQGGNPSWEFAYNMTAPVEVETKRLQSGTNTYLYSYEYYDGWGRPIQTQTRANDTGERLIQATLYGGRGQLRRQSGVFLDTTAEAGNGWFDPTWTGSNPSADLHTVYTYDALLRTTKAEVIADDSAPNILWNESWTYSGWTTTYTDPDGNDLETTTNIFDAVSAVVEDDGINSNFTTTYDYDPVGRLTNVTDDANNTTTISYDLAGRKTSLEDPDSGDWTYEYDGDDNLITQISEEDTLWFEYDDLSRPTQRRLNDQNGELEAEWFYDATGHLGLLSHSVARSDDWRIQVDHADYDPRNRLTDAVWKVSDGDDANYEHEYAVEWSYDPADRIETITYPGDDSAGAGETVTYTYDGRTGLPATLTGIGNFEYVSAATYTDQSAPLAQTWGAASDTDRLIRTWEYFDDSQRLNKIKAGPNGDLTGTASLTYFYNTGGDVRERIDFRNSAQVECYEYDGLHRLTEAFTSDNIGGTNQDCTNLHQPTGVGAYDHSYEYNAIGTFKKIDGVTHNYGAGNAGPHALTSVGTDSFTYDDAGRQTTRTINSITATLTWTPTGMAATHVAGSNTTEFVYDAEDNRIVRKDPNGTIVTTIAGLWETDGTTDTTHYIFGSHLGAVRNDDGTTNELTFLVTDMLDSVSVGYNHTTSGTITRTWHDPWGTTRATSGITPTELSYTSQRQDPTNLYHYNARLYDPTFKTFLTPDTIVPNPANPQHLNRYAYVNNNPTNYNDPTGHCPAVLLQESTVLCVEYDYEVFADVLSSIGDYLDEGNRIEVRSYTEWFRDEVAGSVVSQACWFFCVQVGVGVDSDGDGHLGFGFGLFGWGLSVEPSAEPIDPSPSPREKHQADRGGFQAEICGLKACLGFRHDEFDEEGELYFSLSGNVPKVGSYYGPYAFWWID